ncbi:CPBP family intramembrane glutamic endopeptidase [Psychroserpens sp. SPM9]|uniref:CPBP family intramembrane glutamic endopeptidase n=1 Tax=Psychroserpens sp. SPM9 TaxID=2975598 RepID=UPI0021A429FA|nr:CPBP family intramembrane glutamic endopeptidase [Psychroserpens sp. SPM9]MDG5491317.1 CPBP family intramembrane metalloprotease [Psychroserpens sp. SPM9]
MITSNKSRFKTATVVVILFVIGTLLNIPFSRELKRLKIEAGDANVKLSDSIFIDVIQTGLYGLILGVILVFVGLWISKKAELGAPVIESFFLNQKNRTQPHFFKTLLYPLAFSIVLALIILLVHKLIRDYFPVTSIIERPAKPFYAIVSFSAGITEEIMFRLGLMSLIVVVIQRFKKETKPLASVVWVSIIITALCFGLMHLPLSKNFSNLTLVTVSSTMIGNLITGSFFGWVYWKRGLLAAIIVHIVWDLVFHVVGSPYL